MEKSRFNLCTAIIMVLGLTAQAGQADEALMEGIHPFICEGTSIVLIEDSTGWGWPDSPTFEVRKTKRGWRMEQETSGRVAFLQKDAKQGDWSINLLAEDEYQRIECLDLAESASSIVDTIKPRLNENIELTQRELAHVQGELERIKGELSSATMTTERVEMELNQARREVKQSQSSQADYEKREAELKRIRYEHSQAVKKIAGLQGELNQARRELKSSKAKTQKLMSAFASGELSPAIEAIEFLEALVQMSPGERNAAIGNSSLESKAAHQVGMVGDCKRFLRDKAELSDECKVALIDFLIVEGLN